jgi:maltooligosyltrehalose trehalohydrolase
MQALPMDKLGCRESAPGVLDFGILLPWVTSQDGNRVSVKIIHERDQFLHDIPPLQFELAHSPDPDYADYWSTRVSVAERPPSVDQRSAWGQPGRYVYRYALKPPGSDQEIDWIIDPFAREFGVGKLSAVTVGYEPYVWSDGETQWKTPPLSDLVMYELMLSEFGGGVDGTIELLDYLADLGVNCIEVMPVSNVAHTVDWGFMPLGYFGVDERFGKRRDLQRLIDAAHGRGIAVILDSVYGHTDADFAYDYAYRRLGYRENPFMGPFAKDYFGESTDFRRRLTQDFFFTVNHHWLDAYHVDGFRYDCVPNYWDGSTGVGYANLVYSTYELVKAKQGQADHWQRFFGQGTINLIQCAEQLEAPVEILNSTYSNCTWQNETFGSATGAARGSSDELTRLGFRLGLAGYPRQGVHNGDVVAKSALQYIENHDHSRFVCNFGMFSSGNELLDEGRRDRWYKVQPYLIALFTGCGIPMLWQGQEFGENYYLPDQGFGRVAFYRPVRWDYFYDEIGRSTVWLVRVLIELRRQEGQFRSGEHFFYNDYDRYQSKGVLLFSRSDENAFSLVALNFSDTEAAVPFSFEIGGHYREELHGMDLGNVVAGTETWLQVPSNYGRVWSTKIPGG